jgi:hypothetical protein
MRWLFLTLFLAPSMALAQVAPVPPTDGVDFAQLAATLLNGITHGSWGIVASAAIVLVVALVRRFGKALIPAAAPFLDHPVVAWLLPTLAAIAGALLAALGAGQTVSIGLVLSAVVTGLSANGLFVGVKKAQEAAAAGEAAAAKVDGKAAAVDVLKG